MTNDLKGEVAPSTGLEWRQEIMQKIKNKCKKASYIWAASVIHVMNMQNFQDFFFNTNKM